MRRTIALIIAPLFCAATGHAAPGVTTSNVNFRNGPGTGYESLGVLQAGTAVDILECNEGGLWCAVAVGDQSGFVSGNYLQETAPAVDEPDGVDVVEPGSDPAADSQEFTEEELDVLVAPVALYPDSLLTQVLVAATVPLDVVKAERWIEANKDLAVDQREARVAEQDWDESVAVLAAGFPEVIGKLAGDLDWTQNLGDAVVIQEDDVLDAVQRQRARAEAVGNLATNEAQVVSSEDDGSIVIEPAKPDVVYVPQYDPVTTYTTAATAAPVYVESDDDFDAGAVLATGAIAFGAGLAINQVFDSGYRDYWYGSRPIIWGQNNFYPRPIYPVRPVAPWPGNPDWNDRPGGRPGLPGWDGGRPGDRPGRPGWDGGRPGDRPGRPDWGDGRPGDRPGRPGIGPDRPTTRPWQPDDRRRSEARRRVGDERRRAGGGPAGAANRPGPAANRPGAGAGQGLASTRPAGSLNTRPAGGTARSSQLERKLQTRSGGGGPKATRPAGSNQKAAVRKAAPKKSAVSRPKTSSAAAKKAASRGHASAGKAAGHRPAAARPKHAVKPRAPQRARSHAAPKHSAMRRPSGGGHRATAHASRGHKSRGGGGGRRRR